jgi:hypothetical protein
MGCLDGVSLVIKEIIANSYDATCEDFEKLVRALPIGLTDFYEKS